MLNFSLSKQVKQELEDYFTKKLHLARVSKDGESARYLYRGGGSYAYNQADTIGMIDLYSNSQFESGELDENGQRKIFLNVCSFRAEVASKQIDIDVKNFRFIPDEYANPWTAFFLQKDFKEWAKEHKLGEMVNTLVEDFPRYGTVVLKRVGNELIPVPLQNIRCQQDAASLQESSFVIEDHFDMRPWEIQKMPWRIGSLDMRFDRKYHVQERYGYVTKKWFKETRNAFFNDNLAVEEGDENRFVNTMCIFTITKKQNDKDTEHIFFLAEREERPYREAHYKRRAGRWLSVGVVEELIENQVGVNIVANARRKALQWSSKQIQQTVNADLTAKNLMRDVEDGEILEVGPNGELKKVDFSNRSDGEFERFLQQFERNADQKAFTYEVATGEALPSGTPFRLGVVLQNATNSHFGLKQEKLGLFLKEAILGFIVPRFIKDMRDKDRVVSFFSDEPGFEALKEAAMDYVRSEAARVALLKGQVVDFSTLETAIQPFEATKAFFFDVPKDFYKDAKFKFDFTVTGEEIDLQTQIESLKSLYEVMARNGDPRAEKVLARIAALSGIDINAFGAPEDAMRKSQQVNPTQVTPAQQTQNATVTA